MAKLGDKAFERFYLSYKGTKRHQPLRNLQKRWTDREVFAHLYKPLLDEILQSLDPIGEDEVRSPASVLRYRQRAITEGLDSLDIDRRRSLKDLAASWTKFGPEPAIKHM